MLANLKDLVVPAAESHYSVACFSIFGWEDACAVVEAATAMNAPLIFGVGADFRRTMPLEVISAMLRRLAADAPVPICVHLDHCYDLSEVQRAVDAGFTSVMYDGSQLPLADNIAGTRQIAEYAHAAGCSVEGEIGSVPYAEGRSHIKSELSGVSDAARLAGESGLDALAISVGNVHRLSAPGATVDYELLGRIEASVPVPLVIHGTSGLYDADIVRLTRTRVAKFNIGTVLRQAFGSSLRETLQRYPARFDRLEIMSDVMPAVTREARRMIGLLGWPLEAAVRYQA